VPVTNRCVGAKILATDDRPKRVTGLFEFHAADRTADNPLGLVVMRYADLVIAAGGPGELNRDSVYPKHCFGAQQLALEAGVEAVNLTESQFGIGAMDFPGICRERTRSAYFTSIPSIPIASSAISSATTIERRRSSPPAFSARAINGRSMPRECSTSVLALPMLRSFARPGWDEKSWWISIGILSLFRTARLSRSI
jgi:hypothetical protein